MPADQAITEAPVIIERQGALGVIRLNRPKALNSLTTQMIRLITAALGRFENDPSIGVVLVEGAGERGLCAGGDIRALHDSSRADDGQAMTFLREEYVLNARIAHYPKPYVAFMDGITMGGGVGLSAHAKHRIVTERTRLAMPEVGIGFVPDIGATWLLSRNPGELGTYLALTGETIGAGDAIAVGLADHMVAAINLPRLRKALAALGPAQDADAVDDAVGNFAIDAALGPCAQHRLLIDRALRHDRVETILLALDSDGSDFAAAAAKTMRAKSPTSVKLTLCLLRLGRTSQTLEECLQREFHCGTGILGSADFFEGVRAAVIDKDRNPRWSPARIEDVSDDAIAACLAATRYDAPIFQVS